MGRRFSIELSPKSGALQAFMVYLDGELALRSQGGDLTWSSELAAGPVLVAIEAHGSVGSRYHVELELVDETNEMTIIRTLHEDIDRFEQRL